MSARLLFRIDPVVGESPRGYLCRAAFEHGYFNPTALMQIAGLPASGLDREKSISQLSYALRFEPEEWRSMCYHPIKGRNQFKQRSFCGMRISADDLNYKHPRLCPACLRERAIWWAVWDLGLVVACPVHRCLLLDQCPACKRKVSWSRPAVYRCRCGLDFRDLAVQIVDDGLVAIQAAIYRASGIFAGQNSDLDLEDSRFPPEMFRLKLGALLRLLLFVGAITDGSILRRKQLPFVATNFTTATDICRGAVALLQDWPRPFHEVLRRMVPSSTNIAALNLGEIFGNFYRHLFHVLPRDEFGFLHDAFQQFVIDDWPGLIRSQHLCFSPVLRQKSKWVVANEAERLAHTTGQNIAELARRGQLDSISFKVRRGAGRSELWIRRESLNQWIANRDLNLVHHMTRPEACRTLGLKNITIMAVARAGLIRYTTRRERNFPGGFLFLREDVIRIKEAFETRALPVREYTKPGAVIALRHALRNYLGRDAGLPAVIRAVVNGDLVPVGYTEHFPGITGYLFSSRQLLKYRPVPDADAFPEGFLNYREAGAILNVRTEVIRGLVDAGILNARQTRNGFSKLLSAADVGQFASQYLTSPALAKLLKLNVRSLPRVLKEARVSALAIPITGKGRALFLRKEIVANLRMSQLIPQSAS